MAARHTATKLGRTRGWGQCPVGPCMLEKSREQVEAGLQWGAHSREVGGRVLVSHGLGCCCVLCGAP